MYVTVKVTKQRFVAYHRPLEVLGAFFELLKSLILICRTLHYGGDLWLANIFQNGLELVGCGRVFGDVQLKLGP